MNNNLGRPEWAPPALKQGDLVRSLPGAGQPAIVGYIAYIERDLATITLADGDARAKRVTRSLRNLRKVEG